MLLQIMALHYLPHRHTGINYPQTYMEYAHHHIWTPDMTTAPNDVGFVEATDMELSR